MMADDLRWLGILIKQAIAFLVESASFHCVCFAESLGVLYNFLEHCQNDYHRKGIHSIQRSHELFKSIIITHSDHSVSKHILFEV